MLKKTPMKSILVPTDFSEISKNALRYAVGLAQHINATVMLYHNNPDMISPNINTPPEDYMRMIENERLEESQSKLKEMIKEFEELSYQGSEEKIRFALYAEKGLAADSIIKFAEKNAVDFIMMGRRGQSALDGIFLGGVTASVAERTKIPLFAIPKDAVFKPLDKVVYATNFDDDDIEVIDTLLDLTAVFDSKIKCLHINTSASKAKKDKQKMFNLEEQYWFTPYDKINFKVMKDESVQKGIDKYLESENIDLLTMLTHERSFFRNLFRHSHTKEMAFRHQTPLLIIKT